MKQRNHKLRRQLKREMERAEAVETRDLNFREFSVRASSVDEKNRSVEAVIATESPIPEMDWERFEVVPTALLMSGWQSPKTRQIPFLNAHNRSDIGDQLGSARELKTEGQSLVGRLFFSETATEAFTKMREGHVTDVSVGYRAIEKQFIPRGTSQVINGRSFSGPMNVVTKWVSREVSLVPIGADEQAKMRGVDLTKPPRNPKEFHMDPELRALLVSRGMDEKLSDADAQKWQIEYLRKESEAKKKADDAEKQRQVSQDAAKSAGPTDAELEARAEKALKIAAAKRQERRKEIDSLCDLADIGTESRSELYGIDDIKAIRDKIVELKAERAKQFDIPGAPIIVPGPAQRDKHQGALRTAILMRAIDGAVHADGVAADFNKNREQILEKHIPKAERAAGWEQFQHASLLDLARECVESEGIRTRGMTRDQIAMCALGFAHQAGIRTGLPAYHTTGSFANLTQDAINKSMQVGYAEAPSTWEGPMRRGTSVPDFKTINRYRLGGVPNIPVWPDNSNPKQGSFADGKESYAVEARSLELSFSYRLIVNDDMDALSKAPAALGAASRRTVNAVAWSVITANPTMSDGVALFSAATGNRKRDNLQTGSASPTTTTVGAMTKLMRLMRGENTPEQNESDDVLNLQPKYIVGPAALEVLIGQLVNSAYDPNSTTGLQNYNPNRVLTPIIEPLLDASSTTAWYLFASPMQIDTVEVTFLQGQESPVLRSWTDERSLALCWTVLQTFGAKALNHRGIQKHAGA